MVGRELWMAEVFDELRDRVVVPCRRPLRSAVDEIMARIRMREEAEREAVGQLSAGIKTIGDMEKLIEAKVCRGVEEALGR